MFGCFLAALRKYAVFSGRASRKEYWAFQLYYFLLMILATILDAVIGTGIILQIILMLALFLPALAVMIRRLHDADRTGWWVLLMFIPIVNIIAWIVFGVMEGTAGENRFGPPAPSC